MFFDSELGADALDLIAGHADALPGVAAVAPLLPEVPPAAGGGAHEDQAAVGRRQHRPHGLVELVGNADEALEDADLIELTPDVDVSTESIAIYRRVCWRFLGINWHCEHYRWPSAVVPYTFANDWNDTSTTQNENTMMRDRILDAIG